MPIYVPSGIRPITLTRIDGLRDALACAIAIAMSVFDRKSGVFTDSTTGDRYDYYESRLWWRIEHLLYRLIDRLRGHARYPRTSDG